MDKNPARQRQRGNDLDLTGHAIRANVKRVRAASQIDLRELSSRLGKVGRLIPPSGLSKLENGTRQVTVDDLMALSVALKVSPLELLLPNKPAQGEVATAVPDDLTVDEVRAWAIGETELTHEALQAFWTRNCERWTRELAKMQHLYNQADLGDTLLSMYGHNIDALTARIARVNERLEELEAITGQRVEIMPPATTVTKTPRGNKRG